MKIDEINTFLNRFLSITKYDIEIRVVPPKKPLFSRDINEIVKYISKNIDRNIYFGVYSREGGGKKENVREATCIFADLDFKSYLDGEEEVISVLSNIKQKPSIIVHSGNGYHAYWMFKESIIAEENIEKVLRGIAKHIKSDIKVAELARILRVPGTFNYKKGEKKEVRLIKFNDNVYTLDDFNEYIDSGIQEFDDTFSQEECLASGEYTIEELCDNCLFIKYCYEHKTDLSEALWYEMVSNVSRLPNGSDLVHSLSEGYPSYNVRETDLKIAHALKSGPHTCEYIKRDMRSLIGFDCGKTCPSKSPIGNLVKYGKESNEYIWSVKHGGLFKIKIDKKGNEIYQKVSNFKGVIIEDISMDDGKEIEKMLTIQIDYIKDGKINSINATVPAKKFNSMSWITEQFPSLCIVEPGYTIKDYVRHSIQVLSKKVKNETVYAYTGWNKDKDGWFYMTSNGAIGRNGINVKLPFRNKNIYSIPVIPENEIEAIKASLYFTQIGNEDIVIPLWLYTYMSVLTTIISPIPNFLLYLYGKTGTFKTALSLLLLAHFTDYSILQRSGESYTNFNDTANAIEKRGFHLKDTLLLLDDYCPTTDSNTARNMNDILNRVIRNYSNRISRKRLKSDTSERGSYEPRGLLIVTAENNVDVESAVARLLEIDIKKGSIDREKLLELQIKASLLPHAMSSFINWLIPYIEDIYNNFNKEFSKKRSELEKSSHINMHEKHIEHATYLIVTSKIISKFLIDKSILTEQGAREFKNRIENILISRQETESVSLHEASEINLFYDTIHTLLSQGIIYLYNKETGECTSKISYGGELRDVKTYTPNIGSINEDNKIPTTADPRIKGSFVGWYDDLWFYFIPSAIIQSVFEFFKHSGNIFPVKARTLKKRLLESSYMQVGDKIHLSYVVKIGDKTTRVMKIRKLE